MFALKKSQSGVNLPQHCAMTPVIVPQSCKAFVFSFPAVCRDGKAGAGQDTQKLFLSVWDPRGPGFPADFGVCATSPLWCPNCPVTRLC